METLGELQRHRVLGILGRALAYFMRWLQSDGQDPLLWYIIALEALLGEKGKG
jgi:hypothetical protein